MSSFDESEYQQLDAQADAVINGVNQESAESNDLIGEVVKRIEEANLWKHLISNSVFQDDSARTEIVAEVNAKIASLAKKELAHLLGITQRQEAQASMSSLFTTEQLEVLTAVTKLDPQQVGALMVIANKLLKRNESVDLLALNNQPKTNTIAPSNQVTNFQPQINKKLAPETKKAVQAAQAVAKPAAAPVKAQAPSAVQPVRPHPGKTIPKKPKGAIPQPTTAQMISHLSKGGGGANITSEIPIGNSMMSNLLNAVGAQQTITDVGGPSSSDAGDTNDRQ